MATNPKSNHSVISQLVTLFVVTIPVLLGCNFVPRDKNGNVPKDVADAFVQAIRQGRIEEAKNLWDTNSVDAVEQNFNTSFEKFWRDRLECEEYELTDTKKGKGGYYRIGFRGLKSNGMETRSALYLRLVNGRWLFGEDLWIRDPKDQQATTNDASE